MRAKKQCRHSSYRQCQRKLEQKILLKIWSLIVLSRFLSLLILMLSYYRERF